MSWTLFPIYGLTIIEPDAWLDNPIFKDATIVSVMAFEITISRRSATTTPLFSLTESCQKRSTFRALSLPRFGGHPERDYSRRSSINAAAQDTLSAKSGRLQSLVDEAVYNGAGGVVVEKGVDAANASRKRARAWNPSRIRIPTCTVTSIPARDRKCPLDRAVSSRC